LYIAAGYKGHVFMTFAVMFNPKRLV